MYGYIRLLKTENDAKEYDYYRSIYCSLCHSLEYNFGQVPRFLLSYDVTFMALIADALCPYQDGDSKLQAKNQNCWHGLGKTTAVFANRAYLDYAANVSLLLAEQKLLDDKLDKEHFSRRIISQFLFKSAFLQAQKNYPEVSANIASAMQNFNNLEAKFKTDIEKDCKSVFSFANSFVQTNCQVQIKSCLQDLSKHVPACLETSCAFSEVLAQVFKNIPLCVDIVDRPQTTPINIRKFATQDDLGNKLTDCLAVIGAYLGSWLYLIDALSDLAADIMHDKFNILLTTMPKDLRSIVKSNLRQKHANLTNRLTSLTSRNKWQTQSYTWRPVESLAKHERTIFNLLQSSSQAIQNLQNILDCSMALLPYQRSASLLSKIVQLGLYSSLEHNKLRQAYLFNLLQVSNN